MNRQKIIILPLTQTGRKYGYIMWKKKQDVLVKELFGNNRCVDLHIKGGLQRRKRIDWDHRRIGITYTITRGLNSSVSKIKICQINKKRFSVSFE